MVVSGLAQSADQIRSHHYHVGHGLSSNLVYSFAQDQNGMMWIATSNGLNRFDGNNFKVFRKDYTDLNSVRDNMIIKIAIDSHNNVWMGYGSGGFSCYNQTTRLFTHYLPDSTKPNTIPYGGVDGICIDSKNRVWLGIALKGLSCFDPATGKFKNYGLLPFGSKKRSLKGQQYYNRLTHLQVDSSGTLWLATGDGFYSLNTETDSWKVYRFNNEEEDISKWKPDVFSFFYRKDQENFYVGGWGRGLNHLNLATGKWETFLVNPDKPNSGTNNIVSAIQYKSKNELWVSNGDTVLTIFNTDTKKFTPVSNSELMKNSIPFNNLGLLYADIAGNIWMAHANGFHVIEQGTQEFKFTKLKVTHTDNKEFYHITSSLTDPLTGKLFIGTGFADGLNVIDTNGIQEHFLFDVDKDDPIYSISSLYLDSENTIWIATPENLYQFDRNQNKMIKLPAPACDTSTKSYAYYAGFKEDHKGNLWISTYNHGVYIYNYQTKNYTQLFYQKDNSNSLRSNIITGLNITPNGDVWFGYKADGVSKYNPQTKQFTHYTHDPSKPKSLLDNRIFEIESDDQGQVWIATAMGLIRKDASCKEGEFNNFIIGQQLLGILVSQIEFDKSGKLWMVSTNGLSVLNPSNNKVKNYNITNGINSIFESLGIHSNHPGFIMLGTFSGYYKFNPSIADQSHKPGQVMITGFNAGGKEIAFENEIALNHRINLSPADNFFTIEFNTINFTNPVGNIYYYRLSDEEWKQVPRKGYASYSHLPGGDYLFEVKVMNASGEFSDITRVPIYIETPFYKTPWFTSLFALLISGSIFLLYRIRVKHIEKTEAIKTQLNKQIAETEMRALRAQMNPHFIFNCLNSINRYIIKNDQKTASLYLTKFAKLIRLILDNSEQHMVSLSQELEALKLYIDIEALRFDHRFTYEIDIDEDVYTDSVYVPSMIIQPFVENAIWHGLLHKETHGKLTIRIKREPELLIVEVEDDGVGREKAMEMKSKSATTRKSLGLKITADRLKMVHSNNASEGGIDYIDLYNSNKEATGTLVRIKIPVDSEI